MVRFPSQPESGESASETERLAPVTPLRRAARSPEASSVHPSLRAGNAPSNAPVVALPNARGERWNDTWAEEPSAPPEHAEPDEETERLTRKATGVTIRQLARRGMSRWELEQVLIKREITPDVFGPELDRLETMGLIDDASLAALLVFTQHSRKGLGRTAIAQDLKRRHIDPELIDLALADIADEDELERAIELATKRIGQLSAHDDETIRRRLHGFLARKGYASGIVSQAMDAAFASRRHRGVRFE